MQLNRPRPFLCICVFVASLTHAKNDVFIKNGERTNPKKYHPASTTRSPYLDYKYYGSNSGNGKLRHSSSKHPHFDQIKSRIAGLENSRSSSISNNRLFVSDISSNSNNNNNNKWGTVPRLRHHGWSNRLRTTTTTTTTTSSPYSEEEEDLFDNYGELENMDDTKDDYEDSIFEADDDDDGDEDHDIYSIQAEEPTSTEWSTPGPKRYSSLSEQKWDQLGTMQGVQQARRSYMQQKDAPLKKSSEETKTKAVVDHYIRVKNYGQCKKPIPKVIPVHSEHPDSSVTYIPHCTVLHRCAEDTGCCKYDTTCQFKERVEVILYFYVKPIGADHAKVEKLKFYNHTQCECREKSKNLPTDQLQNTTERQKRVAQDIGNPISSTFVSSSVVSNNKMPETLAIKCKCPKEFIPKIKNVSKCYCDCDPDNEDCLRMKRGKEFLSLVDRKCIQNKECGSVTCDYGLYNKQKGRCPRFEEA